MRINVPIYLTRDRHDGVQRIAVRPLFHPAPVATGSDLGRTIASFHSKLREYLTQASRGVNHRELTRFHDEEPLGHQRLNLHLDLGDHTEVLWVLIVLVGERDRKIAFSPSLPDLWFDVVRGESLEERATEVYQTHFRAALKGKSRFKDSGNSVQSCSIQGKAWIDVVTIDISPGGRVPPEVDPLRAFLGGADVSDGAGELQKVGHCLNFVPLDDLAAPIGVDDDLRRLSTLISVGDRRCVVLVGPSGSGKTARIEGVAAKLPRKGSKRLMWQLSPARLISGMSYLGQWQERVLSIWQHAHRFDHVLVFDDLLGLFEAGKTRDSAMCVADMMRTQLDASPVRIVAEMTPEAWAIFRNRDPKFAANFVVMPTTAMSREQATRVVVQVSQRLEERYRCLFQIGAHDEIVSLQDRFDNASVLPGKAIASLQTLATKNPKSVISRDKILREFSARSGLRMSVIDREAHTHRADLLKRVQSQVVGQDEAVNALVDRAMVTIARLNDTTRPLGTYLLVGPTGVGKTELAKAIASCLFDEGGLIRIDMNELSAPGAASRLIGTFDSPDGLLTAAVRRRPHAVLLLDEIEKAHPSVLNMLLPALGEARLSDARGRVVDLSGLLILMTSNLGSRQSASTTGFVPGDDAAYVRLKHNRAVRDFFRPEFFNRIDDVLHFDRLCVESIEAIAWLQVQRLLRRDGLRRRNVLIDISMDAIRSTAIAGMDAAMGARALKRQIERDLVRPAAETLSANPADVPMLLSIAAPRPTSMLNHRAASHDQASNLIPASDSKWQITCQPIRYYPKSTPAEWTQQQWCEQAATLLEEIRPQLSTEPIRYETGSDSGGINTKLIEQLTIRESFEDCMLLLDQLEESLQQHVISPPATPLHQVGSGPNSDKLHGDSNPKYRRDDFQAHLEIQEYWDDVLTREPAEGVESIQSQLRIAAGRLLSQVKHQDQPIRWQVDLRSYGDSEANEHQQDVETMPWATGNENALRILALIMVDWLKTHEGLQARIEKTVNVPRDNRNCTMIVEGVLAAASIEQLVGGWQFVDKHGGVKLVTVMARPLGEHEPSSAPIEPTVPLPMIRWIIEFEKDLLDVAKGQRVTARTGFMGITELLERSYAWIPTE